MAYKTEAMPHDAAGQNLRERFGEPSLYMEDRSGRCAVVVDDHCYRCLLWHEDSQKWESITHIFRELFEAMVKLPSPT